MHAIMTEFFDPKVRKSGYKMCMFQYQSTALLRTSGSAGQIDGIECGLFSNHAPLGQITLRVGQVSVKCTRGS